MSVMAELGERAMKGWRHAHLFKQFLEETDAQNTH